MQENKISKEEISKFLNGTDPMERIIKIECGYNDEKVSIIYRNENGEKRIKKEYYYPFVWAKQSTARQMFKGDKERTKIEMSQNGISCKLLRTHKDDGTIPPRMENGYKLLFYAKTPMTYTAFMNFFKKSGRPIYPTTKDANYGIKEYIAVSPVEQYMIKTGRRLFKGYDNYDDLLRMQWDLETEGLNPNIHAISQIGIRTNKGYEKILTIEGDGEEKLKNEFDAICEFFKIINEQQPDVISGHNTENFDWNFIDVRLSLRGLNMSDFTLKYFRNGVYKKKKQQVLKLGGEMEYYYPTIMWGTNLTDSLFAVRRAQAIDSNMKSANLKYVTKYSNIAKKNRVYVQGKLIDTVWRDTSLSYAFNDDNGEWFKIDENIINKTFINEQNKTVRRYTITDKLFDNKEKTTFEITTGRYIVQRYLMDDLWETDKVELQYNQSNYLVSKMLPTSYEKVCTMGTAAIWKYIMLAWSYENGLGIPEITSKVPFVGGLSRLLSVGRVSDVVKLDYNSLYPSIILTYNIDNSVDVMGVLLAMLEYVLSMREYYKEEKSIHGKNAKKLQKTLESGNLPLFDINQINDDIKKEKLLQSRANTLQLPLKILGNSYFGGASSGTPFPWTDTLCRGPEQTTCTGRQMLRLMISHFSNIGTKNGYSEEYNYQPIVGDSFTADTPLFIKYNDSNLIDIKPISKLISEKDIEIDALGREYDYSKKSFKVLCRSGWVEPSYIYRHGTDKPMYRITENDMTVDVTEDHSLFNVNQEKIKPSEINGNTKLEYFKENIYSDFNNLTEKDEIDDVWVWLLNSAVRIKKQFLQDFDFKKYNGSKTDLARILYLKKCVDANN